MSWDDYRRAVERGTRRWGERFDGSAFEAVPSSIRSRFGERVILRRTYPGGETWTRYGRLSATTGWRPSLLLVGRDSSSGSSDLIGADDVLLAYGYGGRYVSATTGERVRVADLGAVLAW